jgi:hypothetical protein
VFDQTENTAISNRLVEDKFRKITLRGEVTPDIGISVGLHAESTKHIAFQ